MEIIALGKTIIVIYREKKLQRLLNFVDKCFLSGFTFKIAVQIAV